MMKIFVSISIYLMSSDLLMACPACAGGTINSPSQSSSTLIILGSFILLTYIPFYLFYKATKKYSPDSATTSQVSKEGSNSSS